MRINLARRSHSKPLLRHAATIFTVSILVAIPIWGLTTEPADVESLITGHRWTEASRALYLEAKLVDPIEWSITINQAKSGFVEDAIASAQLMFSTSRPGLLLAAVRQAPALSVRRQQELVQFALEGVRSVPEKDRLAVAGDLTVISLLYLDWGLDDAAQAVYEEALQVVEKMVPRLNDRSYRRVSEELVKADVSLLREWMLEPLLKLVSGTPDPFNEALTYRDLSQIVYRMGRPAEVKRLLNQGIIASNKMNAGQRKWTAIQALARQAVRMGEIEFADHYGDPQDLLPEYAVYEAAQGNRSKALAIVSTLSNTLYVGYRSETQSRIVSEAIRRNDLASAIYYAERLTESASWEEMKLWTHIAETQAANGDTAAARISYANAEGPLRKKTEHAFLEEITAAVALGESMARHGYRDDGNKIVATTIERIRRIPTRRLADHVWARAEAAPALRKIGKLAQATHLLLEAYHEAHDYPADTSMEKMKKAELLSGIGLAAHRLSEDTQ